MHEEHSIDMSLSSSPPRLGVRFLPTIPSAADSSIIMDDTESGNENSQGDLATKNETDPLRQGNQEIVVNLAEGEESGEEEEDDDDDGLEMRLGSDRSSRNEKRGSSDSTGGTFQPFYTVLGNCGNTLAILASPSKDGGRPP